MVQPVLSVRAYRAAQWPWRRIIGVLFLRVMGKLNSYEAFRSLQKQKTTGDAIRTSCEERKLQLISHDVTCDEYPSATLHEINLDDKLNDRVFLYFHGGGYRKPISDKGHVPVILECAKALGAGKIFVLEYGLTPELQYPGQLYQAACAVNKLLVDMDYQPGQIVVGGDSAGGNLLLALLAHIKEPHPLVPTVQLPKQNSKLRGALAISPWVSTTYTAGSYDENNSKDYLTRSRLELLNQAWVPKQKLWADFLQAPAGFWATLPVESMLFTAGGFEVFRDDIRVLASLIRSETGNEVLEFFEAPGEIHVGPAVDAALGLPPCKSFLEALRWCHDMK